MALTTDPPHDVCSLLSNIGAICSDSLVEFHPRVRDRDDVSVLRCQKSGVLLLSRVDQSDEHYEAIEPASYWGAEGFEGALKKCAVDDDRRFAQWSTVLAAKDVVDVGCGAGGFALRADCVAKTIRAVEPQPGVSEFLSEKSSGRIATAAGLHMVESESADAVTMFHVLEHFRKPLEELKSAFDVLRPGGLLVVEVPHARDLLIELCPAFRDFTFWSEHLVLHTRESLCKLVTEAGFKEISIMGFQRYPVSNHLRWLSQHKPGGHVEWPLLNSPALEVSYTSTLASCDKTDTLLLTARKP